MGIPDILNNGTHETISPEFNHGVIEVLFMTVVLISLVANGAAIPIIYKYQREQIMGFLLLSKSIGNVLSIIGIIPYAMSTYIIKLINLDNHRVLCSLEEGIIFYVFSGVSLSTLCIISYTRYKAIKMPIKWLTVPKTSIKCLCYLGWLVPLFLMAPSAISYRFSKEKQRCLRHWEQINGKLYSIAMALLSFCFPMIFLLMTLIILYVQEKYGSRLIQTTKKIKNSRSKMFWRAQRGVRYLIISFNFCWTPFIVYWILANTVHIFPINNQGQDKKTMFARITVLISSINSAIDPFLYGIGNTTLPREAIKLLNFIKSKFIPNRRTQCPVNMNNMG